MNRIIKSLLDLDRYKLTMSQFAYLFHRNLKVKYAFTNRTKSKKANEILIFLMPYIKEQIELTRKMRFTFFELLHLKTQTKSTGKQLFSDEYIDYLSKSELPPVNVFVVKNELRIETEGEWAITMLWETILLSIVAELYSRYVATERFVDEKLSADQDPIGAYLKIQLEKALKGDEDFLSVIMRPYCDNAMLLLEEKIKAYKHHPTIAFFEFGTRRRFSAELQEKVVRRLNEAFHKQQFIGSSQFMGTSNEYLSMKLCIKAGGTMAHEMFMIQAGLADAATNGNPYAIQESQYQFLREWNKLYGYDLSVALTDTFGSEYFFKNCPQDIAEMYSFREDSSIDMFEYTDVVLDLYKKYKVNSWEKVIVHSNGLDKNKIIALDSYSQGKIKKVYGQGTDLSCDVGLGFPHLSMVIKAVEVDGTFLVKLSDNLAKAIGDPDQVERYKKIFNYVNEKSEAQVY